MYYLAVTRTTSFNYFWHKLSSMCLIFLKLCVPGIKAYMQGKQLLKKGTLDAELSKIYKTEMASAREDYASLCNL